MANVGTSTVAYATQQPTGSLVFVASDGTACVLWNDGTNQKFSYASSPYSSWTTTTLVTGLNMALGGKFRAGSDNIDVVTGGSANVRGNYYPLTKIGATYSLGTSNVITGTTAIGTTAVGNVMQYAGQDPQGRHWIVVGGASTYTAETGYFSPANSPTSTGWTASPATAVAQTGDVNLPAGDQIGNFILRIWWNGTALQYSRADNSAASIGAWATAATIPNLTGSPNGSSRVVFKAISSTQALLAYSTGSGIYAQTHNPSTDTWSTATQLSTNASDRHPAIATDSAGNAWVFWCSFAAANNYALFYKKWNGASFDASATTLVASGTNIANPNVGWGNGMLGATYTVGTANPFTVGWATVTITSKRTIPTSAALQLTSTRTIPASCALLQTVTGHLPYTTVIAGNSPLAWWRVNEASGPSAIDSSGNGKTAPLSGVTTYADGGAIARDSDTSMAFSAVGGLTIPASLNLSGAYGVEFWLKQGGIWEYIGVDYDGASTLTIYHNGAPYTPDASISSGSKKGYGWAGISAAGNLDEIVVYSRLTQAMVTADYQAGSIPFLAVPESAALQLTSTRTVPVSATLSGGHRTIPATAALQATSTRTVGSFAALLATLTRSSGTSSALLQTSARTLAASSAVLVTFSRVCSASAALLATRTRTVPTTTALLLTATRTLPTTAALQSQASRSVPASSALSIARTVPVSVVLLQTQTRTMPATGALLLTQSRQIGATGALLSTASRTMPATVALQSQASRSIPITCALSISRTVPASGALLLTASRSIPASAALQVTNARTVPVSVVLLASPSRNVPTSSALLLTSNRGMPTSAALQATSVRSIPASGALLNQFARTLGTSTALLATLTRSAGANAALLATRTRTITTDGALSLTGTATRTIPATGALLATSSRTIGASAALGLSNVSRTVPVTTALVRQASRSIPASTALQATGSRQVAVSAALLATTSRSIGASAALGLSNVNRTVPTAAALLQQASRNVPASVSLQATGSRQVAASVALVSQASRSIPVNAALIATFSRTLGTSAVLTVPGVKFRDIPCSATLSGGSRIIPASVALRGTQTRSIPCSASISLPVQGLQIGIPASAALQATSTRFVLCTVALLASNALVRFRSGVADVRVRSGTVNIIVS